MNIATKTRLNAEEIKPKIGARALNGKAELLTGEPSAEQVAFTRTRDSTGTLHRAMPHDPNCGRLPHRTILRGDEPFN